MPNAPRKANYVSVCKNAIATNNKRGWVKPDPAIRVSTSKSGKATARGHTVAIKDAQGKIVARIISTQDGNPIIKAGAKVVIVTEYPTEVLE
jgi:hypothetical protein